MMPPRIELSSNTVTAMESVIAQADVLGDESVPVATWRNVMQQVYREYIQSLAGPGGTPAETQEIKQQSWAERFPEWIEPRGETPSSPRAKTLAYDHGGKVVTPVDVMRVRGLSDIPEEQVLPFMEQMVREGWAKLHAVEQRNSGSRPTAWVVRPIVEQIAGEGRADEGSRAGGKVPRDGITFHIAEHHGGSRVGLAEVHRTLSAAAMSQTVEQTRTHMQSAVDQGWAEAITRDLTDNKTDSWQIRELDLS